MNKPQKKGWRYWKQFVLPAVIVLFVPSALSLDVDDHMEIWLVVVLCRFLASALLGAYVGHSMAINEGEGFYKESADAWKSLAMESLELQDKFRADIEKAIEETKSNKQ